ncbi:hypothetical protein Q0601_20395 [Paracoccus onubensis]|uniref:hypothetical protein n=1 Tax=Paracoccus onubensis TaxID=1675788 RepID=UPI0027303E6D|nr:hypothetical protein [Paracoccus onubensis]MDP0929552.1 hypothetical protein [Paracoccus onubensis]
MSFFVFGGSNSIFRDGWITWFAERAGQPVLNRSVGATTTLTGLFRFLMKGEERAPEAGDCIIWEYALNDVNHVARGYRREMLLKNVEHLMVLSRERGCTFVPLIFTPLWQEQAPRRDLYYDMLTKLFLAYGVVPFDVSTAWRHHFGKARMPDSMYLNNPHYARVPQVMDFIANGVAEAANNARVPAAIAPHYTEGRGVTLITGLGREIHQNSIMRVPVTRIPLSIEMNQHGRIAAVCALCQSEPERGIRVQLVPSAGEIRQMRFSTTNQDDQRTILKAISLENALGKRWSDRWAFSPGDRLRLSPARKPGDFYAEHELSKSLASPNIGAPARITGVLVESVMPAP